MAPAPPLTPQQIRNALEITEQDAERRELATRGEAIPPSSVDHRSDPLYIDRFDRATYDVLTEQFVLYDQGGGMTQLPFDSVLRRVEESTHAGTGQFSLIVPTYRRWLGRIWPEQVNERTAPRLVAVVRQIAGARVHRRREIEQTIDLLDWVPVSAATFSGVVRLNLSARGAPRGHRAQPPEGETTAAPHPPEGTIRPQQIPPEHVGSVGPAPPRNPVPGDARPPAARPPATAPPPMPQARIVPVEEYHALQNTFGLPLRTIGVLRRARVDPALVRRVFGAQLANGQMTGAQLETFAGRNGARQIRVIASLVDRGVALRDATGAAERAYQNGVLAYADSLLASGRVVDHQRFEGFLRRWGTQASQARDQQLVLSDAVRRAQRGEWIDFEAGADIVARRDGRSPRLEASQYKNVSGEGSGPVSSNAHDAIEQLAGVNAEIPPEGARRIVTLRLAGAENNRYTAREIQAILQRMLRNWRWSEDAVSRGYARRLPSEFVEEIHVSNPRGSFVFEVRGSQVVLR